MYQQPATVTRSTARPAAPPRIKWQLAGRQVSQAMYYAADKAKKQGQRVYFVTAGQSEMTSLPGATVDDYCANCLGFGRMALEVVMGGPFPNAPQGNQGSADKEPTVHLRPAWHNGAWWQVAREMYLCPLCNSDREIQL
jgi:hypothetical protein